MTIFPLVASLCLRLCIARIRRIQQDSIYLYDFVLWIRLGFSHFPNSKPPDLFLLFFASFLIPLAQQHEADVKKEIVVELMEFKEK